MVSETGIEPLRVGIGQKLVSVDQKTSTTVVMEYPTLWLRILRIFFLTDTWILWVQNFDFSVWSEMVVWDWQGNVIRGSEPNSSRVRVKFQNFHVIRYEKSLIITMWRFLLYVLLYSSKHSTGADSRRIWPPNTRFCSQTHFKRRKIINQCQNWSKIVVIGPKPGFSGQKYFNPKSWVFLKNPKSINGSPELIFGRSGSNEDSILASDTSRA